MESGFERNHNAKVIRSMGKLLVRTPIEPEKKTPEFSASIIVLLFLTTLLLVCTGCGPAYAKDYSDKEIVNAIYLAEGGKGATYPYGIRSIECETENKCRNICLRTVRNNRRRFEQYGHTKYSSFISFLGSRFCPVSGFNLTKSERSLNKNWVRNVEYFLNKEA